MAISRRSSLSAALLFLVSLTSLFAVHPTHRVTAGAEEFLKGDFESVSLSSDGRLTLAPALKELLDTKEAFIHSAVTGSGGVVFIGTGANGKLFRLQPDGTGGEWVKLEEPAVYALAVDKQNRVYAATSPDGKVYRISTDGKAESFYDPGEKFIWDLTFDEQGTLYVATGPRGIIYKVTPDGKGETFFDSEETHIVRLVWDLDKNLLAGSAPGGLLFRISPAGRPYVLVDSPLEEFKAIAVDRYGSVYAGALSGGLTTTAAVTAPAKSLGNNDSEVESTVTVSGASKGGKLEVYRIDRDRMVEKIYSSDDELAFDLLVRSDGTVLLATGNRGRVISIDRNGFSTLVVDTKEEQVTRIIEQGTALLAFTSNLGKIFRINGGPASKGTYESDPFDAKVISQWGTMRWRLVAPTATSAVKLYARSGNTAKPDRTWGDWTGPYVEPAGSPIKAEPARYFQWKIEFEPEARTDALLSSQNGVDLVSVTFQQRNVAPQVSELSVLSPGVALLKPPSNPSGGISPGGPDGAHARAIPPAIRDLETPKMTAPSRKVFVPGARSFTWKAADTNDDILTYSVYLRRIDQAEWTLVAKDLDGTEYTLDGASVPDGTYVVKVAASDLLSNAPSDSQRSELVSKPFEISNSAPGIEWQPVQVQGKEAQVRFVVRSSASFIYQVEYSVDGGDWQVVYPEDGICDSREEQFSLKLTNLAAGSKVLAVRVSDTTGNLGVAATQIQIP
jgi:hypothetical protein